MAESERHGNVSRRAATNNYFYFYFTFVQDNYTYVARVRALIIAKEKRVEFARKLPAIRPDDLAFLLQNRIRALDNPVLYDMCI